jgi:ATP-binding cassette, subfamily B, bacterial
LVLGAVFVLKGQSSLGVMLGLNALAAGFLVPLSTLVAATEQFELLGSYVSRLDDVFGHPPEQDEEKVVTPPRLTGKIRLENVSFRYGDLGPLVVKDVSVEIAAGQSVAIVGRSGCGKSTLASLLLALYRPTSGRILYDGRDLLGLDVREVRRQFGVVIQRPYVFGTTVRQNIALADPTLPLDDVVRAAKLAQIHDEIAAMPMAYETIINGATLSGGQRQRISIARALIRQPAMILFDEATSALDSVTEAQLRGSVDSLGCTRVVIAHRMSTIVDADLILVMKDGAIVERGRHHELLALDGVYAELVRAQLERDEGVPRVLAAARAG